MQSPTTSNPAIHECDVLIIGSGPGGSTVANELASKGLNILMLEEGPNLSPKTLTLPVAVQKLWRNNGLSATLGSTAIPFAEGRCVGGGSEINSSIIQRTPEALLNYWAKKYQIRSFGADEMAPFFDEVFELVNATKPNSSPNSLSDVMIKGAKFLNWEISALERCEDENGKRSMATTLLDSAISKGMTLISGCVVNKIKFRHGKAYLAEAVKTAENGSKILLNIYFQHIFIAAGAIQTPALLQRSGINKNIGETLRMHPTLKALAYFPTKIKAQKYLLAPFAITEFMPNLRLGCSVFKPGFFGMALAENWGLRRHLLDQIDYCGIFYAMLRAEGVGRIRSIPGIREPLITFHLTKNDWELLSQGIDHLAKLLFASDALEIYPSLSNHPGWRNYDALSSDLLLNKLSKNANLFTIHIFSSCPMGENSKLCAADSFGKVFGLDNTYIADASLIPEAPGVNPQATIMAIATRNARYFLKNLGHIN